MPTIDDVTNISGASIWIDDFGLLPAGATDDLPDTAQVAELISSHALATGGAVTAVPSKRAAVRARMPYTGLSLFEIDLSGVEDPATDGRLIGVDGRPHPPEDFDASLTRNTGAVDPINRAGLYISETGWDPRAKPVPTTTTPNEHANLQVGGIYDLPGGGGDEYIWGMIAYLANAGTAPTSGGLFKSYGWKPAGLNSVAWALGNNGSGYGVEVSVGCGSNQATATTHQGGTTLTGVSVTLPGSQFEIGNPITGAGIAPGTTITDVDNPHAPTTIELSAPATTSATVPVKSNSTGQSTYGVLITGVGAQTSIGGPGNPNGRAIHIQSYGDETDSSFLYGLSMGASALRPEGTAIRLSSHTAARGLSFESVNYSESAIRFSSVHTDGSLMSLSGVTATNGINFAASNVFSIAAITLSGQDIATDTAVGMRIATNSTQKVGFFGKTPVARPSVPGAGTVTAADIRTALVNLGLVA